MIKASILIKKIIMRCKHQSLRPRALVDSLVARMQAPAIWEHIARLISKLLSSALLMRPLTLNPCFCQLHEFLGILRLFKAK